MVHLNVHNGTFAPEFKWSKRLKTQDGDQDVPQQYNDSMPLLWKIENKDNTCQGMFEGFFLDDPQNPLLSHAKTLLAGFATSAALFYLA